MKNNLYLRFGVALVAALLLALYAPLSAAVLGTIGIGALLFKSASVRLISAFNTLPANVGSSRESRRYLSSAAIGTKFLVVKAGADDAHCAVVSATADKPMGIVTDEASAAEEPVDVELLGVTARTLPLVAGAAIASLDQSMYVTAAGKVTTKPTAAGTYWRIGTNKTLADADGDPVEVATHAPRKLIVIAALTSTNGTAAAASANLAGLAAEAEKIGDDVRAIAAALDGEADVALATT